MGWEEAWPGSAELKGRVDDGCEIAEFMGTVGRDAGFDDIAIATSAEDVKELLGRSRPGRDHPRSHDARHRRHRAASTVWSRPSRARTLIVSGYDKGIRRMAYNIGAARGLDMAGVVAKPVRVQELGAKLAQLHRALRESG